MPPRNHIASINPTTDATFTALESLISNSHPSKGSAASVLADLGTPSCSISILSHGHLSSHIISTIPSHTTTTAFQACSISKAVAGLALARLIDRGVLKLDDKAVDLLPEDVVESMTADVRTAAAMKSITVRMLMSHTSGLCVHGFPGYPVEIYPDTAHGLPSPKEILASREGVNTPQVRIVAPPGLEFMYSGGGMTVLQVIIERLTKKPFVEIMREAVFEPLGMTRSFYHPVPEGESVAEAYWTGRSKCDSKWHVVIEALAGGLWSTPEDLMRVVRALQDALEGRNDGGEVFITREMAKLMVTKVKFSMGLQWFLKDYAMGHGGSNNPGYRCQMFGYEDLPWNKNNVGDGMESNVEKVEIPKGCGVSVMTNAATGDPVLWKVINAIAWMKGWPEGPPFVSNMEVGAPLAVEGDIERGESQEWKEWIGVWADKDGKYTWKVDGDGEGKPVAGVDNGSSTTLMRLKTAAIPPIRYVGGKKSIDLVLDGTEIMLRLGWEHEKKKGEEAKRTVEMCHHQNQILAPMYAKS